MFRSLPLFLSISLLVGFIFQSVVFARVVTTDWELYGDYQTLISCGAVPRPFYGQRLWTTREIAKLVQAIDLTNIPSPCPQERVASLKDRFATLIAAEGQYTHDRRKFIFKPVEQVALSYNFIPTGDAGFQTSGRGGINATINTFRENRQGTVLGLGHQLSFMSDHEWGIGGQRVVLQPLADLLWSNDLGHADDARLTLHQGYFLFDLWRLTILLGRAPVLWGQAEYGGPIFSENARPLDHIQITPTGAFRLPWFLKYIGELKFSFIFGDLGPEQRYPWPFFTGLILGWKPIQHLEFNMSHVVLFGGQGAPKMGFVPFVREFFGFIPFISNTDNRGANKLSELNMRFFVPPLMAAQGYLSYFMEDANTGSTQAFKKHFLQNSSYQAGILFSCFLFSCDDELRLEYTNSSPIAYRHGEYTDGWTSNQNIIADPLGPDGNRFLISWGRGWADVFRSKLVLSFQSRENKMYAGNLDTVTTFDGPAEKRYTVATKQFIHFPKRPLVLELYAGYEFIANYQFAPGSDQNSLLFSSALKYNFR